MLLRRNAIRGITTSALVAGFPSILRSSDQRPRLRVLGTHVTLQEEIRRKAEEDLGFGIEFTPGGSAAVIHQAATRPESFDIYEQWSNSIRVLWQAGAIQPIEISDLQYWGEINSLAKDGQLRAGDPLGLGDAPYRILFVQNNGSLGEQKTNRISFMPYVHNADSYGYDSRKIPRGIPYQTESWSWLLQEEYHGKVAIVNEPTIGLFDLALAAQSKGLVSFQDMGNMTRPELDRLFDVILDYRARGHFRGVWTSVPQSVSLMENEEVLVQSMFSPGVSSLNGKGIPCVYAAPKEGYRAWHGVMCLSSAVNEERREMAYRFMNWWLSGWAGAFIARQGYYISNPNRARERMTEAEWEYWYEGQPASENLRGTDGAISIKKGSMRTGGSYWRRMGHVAIWNTVMPQYEYSLLKWNEFLQG
jgi:putative spermidine/putrescine transport system substrate-binding protein